MSEKLVAIPKLSAHLIESITAFSTMLQIPVTFFDGRGNIHLEWAKDQKICNLSQQYGDPTSPCGQNLLSSLNYATQLGEPYIFVCRGGLVKIAVALFSDNKLTGGFIAGPIVMGSLRESNISKVLAEDSIDESSFPKLAKALNNTRIFNPKEVSHLSIILNSCILSAVDNMDEYHMKNERYRKQAQLGLEVREYKKANRDMSYPYEMENQVSHLVSSGDTDGASEAILKLLDELYLLEAGDLDAVSIKVNSLFNMLLRNLPHWENTYHEYAMLESGSLDILTGESDYESMKLEAFGIFSDLAIKYSESFYSGSSQIIKDTIDYLNKNFRDKLTLKDTADLFHVNQSYLSLLFKKEMGKNFTEYLTSLRLGEAKKLLKKTSLNLTQIAYRCGFDDQSYFSKVFKKVEGITPRNYRSL